MSTHLEFSEQTRFRISQVVDTLAGERTVYEPCFMDSLLWLFFLTRFVVLCSGNEWAKSAKYASCTSFNWIVIKQDYTGGQLASLAKWHTAACRFSRFSLGLWIRDFDLDSTIFSHTKPHTWNWSSSFVGLFVFYTVPDIERWYDIFSNLLLQNCGVVCGK